MSKTLDLNKLRETILANQRQGDALPVEQRRKIVVDREGQINVGLERSTTSGPVTEVIQDTFHASPSSAMLEAAQYLPSNTRVDDIDGYEVFTYTIDTQFGRPFKLAAYFDGQFFQVKLISPELENSWKNPHVAHIFSDGRLCLSTSHGSGQPTLRQAFAKSVMWAEGVSAMLSGAPVFPYSLNNEND